MIDAATLTQMNGAYVMPDDAGPAWREAFEAGIDMSLLEENLRRTPWERLLANDSALALMRMVQQAKPVPDGKTHVLQQSKLKKFPFGNAYVLTLDGLIVSKSAIGRERDLAAVKQLKAIKEKIEPPNHLE